MNCLTNSSQFVGRHFQIGNRWRCQRFFFLISAYIFSWEEQNQNAYVNRQNVMNIVVSYKISNICHRQIQFGVFTLLSCWESARCFLVLLSLWFQMRAPDFQQPKSRKSPYRLFHLKMVDIRNFATCHITYHRALKNLSPRFSQLPKFENLWPHNNKNIPIPDFSQRQGYGGMVVGETFLSSKVGYHSVVKKKLYIFTSIGSREFLVDKLFVPTSKHRSLEIQM